MISRVAGGSPVRTQRWLVRHRQLACNPACRRAQPPSSRHHSAGVLPGGWRVRSRGSCALSGFGSRPNRVGSTLIPASSSAAVCQLHCSQLMPTAQACKKQAGCNGWTFCWRLDGCGSGCTVSCEPYPWAGQAAHSTCCGGTACGQHLLLLPPRSRRFVNARHCWPWPGGPAFTTVFPPFSCCCRQAPKRDRPHEGARAVWQARVPSQSFYPGSHWLLGGKPACAPSLARQLPA